MTPSVTTHPETLVLACCMIVKDDAQTLERAIASVRPHVAEVNVYLDGPQVDGTADLLARLEASPGPPIRTQQGEVQLWNLAAARQLSFEMASPEIEWVIWLDADDELRGGDDLPEVIRGACWSDAEYVQILYDVADEAPPIWRERLLRRPLGRYWEGRVHDFIREPAGTRYVWADQPVLVRHQQRAMPGPNHHLLELRAAVAAGDDPRAFVYLGTNLVDAGRAGEAIGVLERYLDLGLYEVEGDWNMWEIAAMRTLADAYLQEQRESESFRAAVKAHNRCARWKAAWRRGEAPDPYWPPTTAPPGIASVVP